MASKAKNATFKRKLIAAAVVSCFATSHALAANSGDATVAHGGATFTSNGSTLTITNTPNAIINWARFNIDAGETVRFVQESARSAVLNRVTGNDPSHILGALQSNGKVYLINPNGIMFGANARIDVNGFVASTLNLSDADFLAGRFNFNADRATPGSVVNAGQITTPSGGFVYLLAPNVENSGVITTPSGEAILAAGNSIEIVDSTDPSQRVLVSATSQDVNLSSLMTQSNGNIFTVLNSGKVSANTVVQDQTGKIYFKSAGNVQTTSSSIVEVKGDATADGGRFIGFAGKVGSYAGSFNASGSNGGFVETSGHTLALDPGISVRASAMNPAGEAGLWLLDPTDILIDSSAASSISSSLSGGTSVNITTSSYGGDVGDITVTGTITAAYGSGGVNLTMTADRDIVFSGTGSLVQAATGTGTFNTALNAGRDIVFSGTSGNTIFNNSTSAGMGVTLNATNSIKTLNAVTLNSTSTGLTIAQVANGKTWTNDGTVNLLGKSQIDLDDGSVATFVNNGTVNVINNTAGWSFISNSITQAGIINNNGSFNVTGSTSLEALFNNSSTGLLNITSGTLSMQNANVLSGSINIAAAAILSLSESHAGLRKLDGASISAEGFLSTAGYATTFNNTTWTNSGDMVFSSTSNMTFTGTNTIVAGGSLDFSGTLNGGGSSNLVLTAGENLNVNGASIHSLNSLVLSAGSDVNVSGSSVISSVTNATLIGKNLNISDSLVSADYLTMFAFGGDTVITDSDVYANDMLAVYSNHLDIVANSTSSHLGTNTNGLMDIELEGDLTIKAGPGSTTSASLFGFPDVGSSSLPGISVGGSIFFISGTGGASATIESGTGGSIYIAFPYLSSGGYFVDGIEGVVYNGTSGFVSNDLVPAILGTSLHVTYGGGGLSSRLINLLDDGLLGASDLGSMLNDAIADSTATEDDLLGTGDDGEKKEDKPQQCSA